MGRTLKSTAFTALRQRAQDLTLNSSDRVISSKIITFLNFTRKIKFFKFLIIYYQSQVYSQDLNLKYNFKNLNSLLISRNMTLARRIESRLSTLKLLVTFSLQPSFTCMIPETITTKFAQSCRFQNVVCIFCAFNITGDIKNFVQI